MYNRLYHYFDKNCLVFKKKIAFRAYHSMDHAELEFIDELSEAFNNREYILGIFIDLPKAFDAFDHEILLTKRYIYGVNSKNMYKYKNM